jgi:hypothetical protein
MTPLIHKTLQEERRTIFLLLLLITLFPFLIWYYTSSEYDETLSAYDEIHATCLSLQKIASGQMQNRNLITRYQNKDSLFLQRQVEPFVLLTKEFKERESDSFSSCLPITQEKKDRMHFLQSGSNSFSFIEGKVQQSKQLKETLEVQTKPVEMDESDLETILQRLEKETSTDAKTEEILENRPLFLIETAELERKKKFDRELWLVKFKLLKREFGQGSTKK